MGSLLAIARHHESRAPIEVLAEAEVSSSSGISGDYHGATAGRQLVVVGTEGWSDACRELGKEVPWTARRGNLLVSGVDLYESAHKFLQVGSVILRITEECAPCHVMDKQSPGLRAALKDHWRAGVSCVVIRGGTIHVGDEVSLASVTKQ
jgi:MOSC domain-containing protein YiiM